MKERHTLSSSCPKCRVQNTLFTLAAICVICTSCSRVVLRQQRASLPSMATNSIVFVGMDWDLAQRILSSHGAKEESQGPGVVPIGYKLAGGSILYIILDRPLKAKKGNTIVGMRLCRDPDELKRVWDVSLVQEIDVIGHESLRTVRHARSFGRGSDDP